jgi:hypothetical protein
MEEEITISKKEYMELLKIKDLLIIAENQTSELIEKLREKEKENEELRKENKELRKKIEELWSLIDVRVKEGNPFRRPEIRKRSKKAGQKEGHQGITRPAPEKIDEVKEVKFKGSTCPDCGSRMVEIWERIRYIEDIVPAKVKVTKVIIKEYYCSHCRSKKVPTIVDAFPNCRLGIYAHIYAVFLRKGIGMSMNKTKTLFEKMFGLKISKAEIHLMTLRIASLLKDKYFELIKQLRNSEFVHFDETGWRIDGRNYWLWTFTNGEITIYPISKKRNKKIPEKILGKNYNGISITDFLPIYNKLSCKKQRCLVHLKRKLKETSMKKESGIEFNYFRSRLRRIIDDAIKFGEKEKDVSERIIAKCKFEKKIRDLYSRKWKDKDCIRFSKLLRNHEKELFTFLINPEIKADNNEAERALRPNVILRKITGGNRSKEGADAHSIITSIYQTCNRQNQDFIQWSKDYLQNLITSKL